MEAIRDERLSLLSKIYQQRGENRMAVTVMSAFKFEGGEGAAQYLPEAELWAAAGPVLDMGLNLDEGMPKPGREFFVHGSAHAPAGKVANAVNVSARVGELQRELRVTGDRIWEGNSLSEPKPFSALPVDWAHASGGPDAPGNPLGKGIPAEVGKVPEALPYPNVVDPKAIPLGPDKPPAPASFLPQGVWPVRQAMAGSGDAEWLARGGPGLPADFDWSWFETAGPGQRGGGRFLPGEAFELTGMHPEQPALSGNLPAEPPWARVERLGADGQVHATAIELAQDTVWLFPEQGMGVQIWHGVLPVADGEASEVVALRAGFGEPAGELAAPPALPPPPALAPPPPPPPPPLAKVKADAAAAAAAKTASAAPGIPAAAVMPPPPAEPLRAAPKVASASEAPEEVIAAEFVAGEQAVPEAEVNAGGKPEWHLKPEDYAGTAGAKGRAAMFEAMDTVENEAQIRTGGEELELLNRRLAERGIEPVSEADYTAAVGRFFDQVRRVIAEMRDADFEGLLPPEERSDGLTESEAQEIISQALIQIGVEDGKARDMAADVFTPFDLSGAATLSEMLERMIPIDWEKMPLSRERIDAMGEMSLTDFDEEAVTGVTEAENRAKLDAFLIEHFGKDFATLMDPNDQTIPLPDTREHMEAILKDPEALQVLEPVLRRLYEGPQDGETTPAAELAGLEREILAALSEDARQELERLEAKEAAEAAREARVAAARPEPLRVEKPEAPEELRRSVLKPESELEAERKKKLAMEAGLEEERKRKLEAERKNAAEYGGDGDQPVDEKSGIAAADLKTVDKTAPNGDISAEGKTNGEQTEGKPPEDIFGDAQE